MPRPLWRKPAQVKEIIAMGRQRLGQVNEKIGALKAMKKQLEFLVRHLDESVPTTCPVAAKDATEHARKTSK
jgi:hypothetical protein